MMRCFVIVLTISILMGCGGGGGSSDSSDKKPNKPEYDFVVRGEKTDLFPKEMTDSIEQAFEITASELTAAFVLPRNDVTIVLQDCGVPNAFYDPATSEIIMCWDLLEEMFAQGADWFGADDSEAIVEQALGAYLFVFFHELGHAFIDHYDIAAALGGEENIADDIGAVLMLTFEDIADTAPVMVVQGGFYLADSGSYADNHSTGPTRFANLVCLAWGANPTIADLINVQFALDDLAAAGRDCAYELESKLEETEKLFQDFIK